MKHSILPVLFLTLALGFISFKASGGEQTYHAAMSGCTNCSNCKKKVVMSFAELNGVEGVRFLRNQKDQLHHVIIVTNGAQITKEAAVQALSHIPHFEIKKWEKIAPQS